MSEKPDRSSRAPSRRHVCAGLLALPLLGCVDPVRSVPRDDGPSAAAIGALRAIEEAFGGRLGAAVFDAATGRSVAHRGSERFVLCSTFKLPLAALMLKRMGEGLRGNQMVPLSTEDVVGHAPVTRPLLPNGQATVEDLARAAQVESDNGAANALLRFVGGPVALTAFYRSIGDDCSRLDRYEPELNLGAPGDWRDTGCPASFARGVAAILGGQVLSPDARRTLIDWTVTTATGRNRLRAGFPSQWRTGDKTGTAVANDGQPDRYNDVAAFWQPGCSDPVVVTAFLETSGTAGDGIDPAAEAVLANVGRVAATWAAARA